MPAVPQRVAALTLVSVLVGLAWLPVPVHAVSNHSTAIDLSPDGTELWVVNPDHGTVSVIGTQAPQRDRLLAEIGVGREPWCVKVHPSNGEVWVTSSRDDDVRIIDAASRTVIGTIDTGFETFGVAFDPAGTNALVTVTGADRLLLIDVASRTITQTFDVYRRPRGIAWSADGTRAWVSHLLMTEYFGRLTQLDVSGGSTTEIGLQQCFGTDLAGYGSGMQNITLAPPPFDSVLWMPMTLINSAKGGLSGVPLTPTNIFHAVVRPVDIVAGTDLNWDTYFLSEGGSPNRGYTGGTPVGGAIAVDFRYLKAFVANLFSNNVTVLNRDILNAAERSVIPAGNAPIGVVTHPVLSRAYVANWLSRDVTVIDAVNEAVVTTVPSVTAEVLPADHLHGKRLFFTSTGNMSHENRNSCAGCHTMGRTDGRSWDLSQYGPRQVRATKDWRGAGYTGVLGWTAAFDEIHDNEWSIRGLLGGAGLIDGTPNASLGSPNCGLSRDLDDLSSFILQQTPRPDTPFLATDGSLTAEADSGQTLFHDPVVGCADCHSGTFYTDSSLQLPYLRHDVGTADPTDADALAGLDTPSLCGVWDSGPWLHSQRAKTMADLLTVWNPDDLHGVTSHLSAEQIDFLAEFVMSIGWPESAGTPVAAPEIAAAGATLLQAAFPNPF
ncbi:MAG TPA: YncE family protein, partial [bacterium]|nr:YncE family protein [bacterium]